MEKLTKEIGGKEVAYAGLSRKSIKEMKKGGISLGNLTVENADETADRVFDLVMSPEDVERMNDLPPKDGSAIMFPAIMAATFGVQAEKKTSDGSGSGDQIEPEANIVADV